MPGSIRLFLPTPLYEGAELSATPAQVHYLAHVMRCAIGETVRLFNGTDGEWEARILTLRRDRALLQAERQVRRQQPEPDLWLLFAPLKRDSTDLVIEKATELGVSAILPVLTERTNTARMNPARLQTIATETGETLRHYRRMAGRTFTGRRRGTVRRPAAAAGARAGGPAGRAGGRIHRRGA